MDVAGAFLVLRKESDQLQLGDTLPQLCLTDMPGEGTLVRTALIWTGSSPATGQPTRRKEVVQQRRLSPEDHIIAACRAEHPPGAPPLVPHGFAFAVVAEKSFGANVNKVREHRLQLMRKWIQELKDRQQHLAEQMPSSHYRFVSRPILVFERLLQKIGSPDAITGSLTATGFQDWGAPEPSRMFPLADSRKVMQSLPELLSKAPLRNRLLVTRLQRHHPHADTMGAGCSS